MATTTVNSLGTTNPIQILYGGTNATTAANALTNLGALPIAGGTMTGFLTLNANPTSALEAVTKQYVDSISSGLTVKTPCYAGSTTNLNATYLNGISGVGATLTNAGSDAAFSIDGTSPALNARILVKDQTSTFQNGIYSLTTIGDGSTAWILTRTTDYDTTAEIIPGTFIIINNGTVNTNTGWIETATVTTIGTDPIIFSQFGNPGTVTSVSGTSGQIDVANGTSAAVVSIDAGYVGQTSITTLGTITTGTWNATTITVPHGGTGNNTFTAYSVLCAGNTSTGAFQNVSGIGTSGQVLTSNGASALPTWQTLPGTGTVTSVSGTAGQIDVATGTTTPVISIDAGYVGQTSITTLGTITTGTWTGTTIIVPHGGTGNTTFTAYSLICAGTTATGTFQNVSGVGTAGQVLTSTGASSLPVWGSPTGMPWVDQTSSSVTMAVNTSYVADNAGLVTLTLPATAAFGSTFQVTGKGAGGWRIAQATGQQINFGDLATTSGTSGYLQNTNQFDCVTLVCTTANTQFVVYACIGNITVN